MAERRRKGCTCSGDFWYASLPDHENGCLAQVEHLLTTYTPPEDAQSNGSGGAHV